MGLLPLLPEPEHHGLGVGAGRHPHHRRRDQRHQRLEQLGQDHRPEADRRRRLRLGLVDLLLLVARQRHQSTRRQPVPPARRGHGPLRRADLGPGHRPGRQRRRLPTGPISHTVSKAAGGRDVFDDGGRAAHERTGPLAGAARSSAIRRHPALVVRVHPEVLQKAAAAGRLDARRAAIRPERRRHRADASSGLCGSLEPRLRRYRGRPRRRRRLRGGFRPGLASPATSPRAAGSSPTWRRTWCRSARRTSRLSPGQAAERARELPAVARPHRPGRLPGRRPRVRGRGDRRERRGPAVVPVHLRRGDRPQPRSGRRELAGGRQRRPHARGRRCRRHHPGLQSGDAPRCSRAPLVEVISVADGARSAHLLRLRHTCKARRSSWPIPSRSAT